MKTSYEVTLTDEPATEQDLYCSVWSASEFQTNSKCENFPSIYRTEIVGIKDSFRVEVQPLPVEVKEIGDVSAFAKSFARDFTPAECFRPKKFK